MKRTIRGIPWPILPLVLSVAAVIGTFLFLSGEGYLETKKDSGTNFTAVFAFIGLLVTAAVTLLGTAVNRQGEKRQAVESSLRAIDAMAKADGSPADPLKVGGALLALASLGQMELAIALLSDVWPRRTTSLEAATLLIDRALSDDRPSIQVEAAYTLHANSDQLWLKPRPPSNSPTYCYPDSLYWTWHPEMPFIVKQLLAESWVWFWITSPILVLNRLESLTIGLNEIWRDETHPAIRNSVGVLLETALTVPAFPFPILTTVRGKTRKIERTLAADIRSWRAKRVGHQREIPDLLIREEDVRDFATKEARRIATENKQKKS